MLLHIVVLATSILYTVIVIEKLAGDENYFLFPEFAHFIVTVINYGVLIVAVWWVITNFKQIIDYLFPKC